jgi:hypothetical protein
MSLDADEKCFDAAEPSKALRKGSRLASSSNIFMQLYFMNESYLLKYSLSQIPLTIYIGISNEVDSKLADCLDDIIDG